jgi:peptidoglycan/LPS O-acetylase OafA/YrhL
MLVCAALAPRCLLNRVRVPGAASLALWSYAVYLVHKPVFMALRPQLERLHIDASAPPVVLAVMALGVAGGWLLYRLVELPFMRLRERWYPMQSSTQMDIVSTSTQFIHPDERSRLHSIN